MGLLFFLLILTGFVLEIKSDFSQLSMEQDLPSIIDRLTSENGILHPAPIQNEQVRKLEQRKTEVRLFAANVIYSYNYLHSLPKFTIEDQLITNLFIYDIYSTDINIRNQTKNRQSMLQQIFENVNTMEYLFQRLNKYVESMLRQYAQIQPLQQNIIIQSVTQNNEQILERQRMVLEELTMKVDESYRELQNIEGRDALELDRSNKLVDSIRSTLIYARNQIQNVPLTLEQRSDIVQLIEVRYQLLNCHIQNNLNQYKERIFERRQRKLRDFMKSVEDFHDQLRHVEGRNSVEREMEDQLVKEVYYKLPEYLNRIYKNYFPVYLKLQYIDIIENRYKKLDAHVQKALKEYELQRLAQLKSPNQQPAKQERLIDEIRR